MTAPVRISQIDDAELAQLRSFAAHLRDGSTLSILLTHIMAAVRDGLDVALVDLDAELSPNQAAEFLRMSRPHLLKLLDGGFIPFHRVGRDRRIRHRDLVEFLSRREDARRELAFVDAHRDALAVAAAAESAGVDPELLARLT